MAELSPRPDAPAVMRKLPDPRAGQLRPDGVAAAVVEVGRPAVVEPLAPSRYKVQFTASAELHDKLERLRALMRSSVPDGDLAAIVEQAVTEKLQRLEARRFARTQAPRKTLWQSQTLPGRGRLRPGRHRRSGARHLQPMPSP